MKRLYEEYFGGEMRDTADPKKNMILNRWQYRTLDLLRREQKEAITPKTLEDNLYSMRYKGQLEDSGSRNLNKTAPTREVMDSFIEKTRALGYLDNNLRPSFDSEHTIRREIVFPKLAGPRSAFIEMTPECHLECLHCYNEYARAESKMRLTHEDIEGIIDQLAGFGATFVALTGGETTMADRWDEIGRHAKRLGMDIRLYTCGVYPSGERDDILRKICELNPEEIRITYSGMRETHDLTRRRRDSEQGTFYETTQTVKHLIEAGQKVKLNYTLSHQNTREVEEFIRAVSAMQDRYGQKIPVNIGPLRAYGKAGIGRPGCAELFTAPDASDITQTNLTCAGIGIDYGVEITLAYDCLRSCDPKKILEKREAISRTPWPLKHQGCGFGRNGMSIASDGKAQVCGILGSASLENVLKIISEDPEKYASIGVTTQGVVESAKMNTTTHSIEQIWYESQLLAFFQQAYRKEQCEPCPDYRTKCMGICPGMALHDSGDMRKGDKACPKTLMIPKS